MTNLKTIQNELNAIRKTLEHLNKYQETLEDLDEWDNVQKTKGELYGIEIKLQNQKIELKLKEIIQNDKSRKN